MHTILIADDEDDVLALVRMTLTNGERQVLLAVDGEEAVATAREQHPDLVILDLMMPKMDGIESCRIIKADSATAGVPIIMLTAMNRQEDHDRAAQAGADGYLVKPFSPTELIHAVERALAAR